MSKLRELVNVREHGAAAERGEGGENADRAQVNACALVTGSGGMLRTPAGGGRMGARRGYITTRFRIQNYG